MPPCLSVRIETDKAGTTVRHPENCSVSLNENVEAYEKCCLVLKTKARPVNSDDVSVDVSALLKTICRFKYPNKILFNIEDKSSVGQQF